MQQHNQPAREIASGRWPQILTALGIDRQFLRNKHGPCPVCQGKDRFRFDDKGSGKFYCNQCGPGDGFKLLELYHGWTFREAAKEVEAIAGIYSPSPVARTEEDERARKIAAARHVWGETIEVSEGDPVWMYLKRRTGVESIPKSIRFHPALPYINKDEESDFLPALVAMVVNPGGQGIGVHRIYLTAHGEKAAVRVPKKLLGASKDGAVRLGPVVDRIGIAEGIETALAAATRFGIPTWAAISAGGLEQWNPPAEIKHVTIFGDNDYSFTGQWASFSLARRMRQAGLSVEVMIPSMLGSDWADQ